LSLHEENPEHEVKLQRKHWKCYSWLSDFKGCYSWVRCTVQL